MLAPVPMGVSSKSVEVGGQIRTVAFRMSASRASESDSAAKTPTAESEAMETDTAAETDTDAVPETDAVPAESAETAAPSESQSHPAAPLPDPNGGADLANGKRADPLTEAERQALELEGLYVCGALAAGEHTDYLGRTLPEPIGGSLPSSEAEQLKLESVTVADRKSHATADLIICHTDGGDIQFLRNIATGEIDKLLLTSSIEDAD